MNPSSLALILLASFSSCIGNLLLKVSRAGVTPDHGFVPQLLTLSFFGGLLFYAINVVLFAKALDRVPVSVAYPILATGGFALLAIASAWLLGERLTGLQGLGLVVAILGISLLALG
jgi:multidrug transporter EmrE-like cation transporter